MARDWLVLIYKVPSEPTRYRASVWRKLKAAGAVYLQNGVAALPADPEGEEAIDAASREVEGVGGTAYLLRSTLVGADAKLEGAFNEARDAEYTEVVGRCRDFHTELEKERAVQNLTFAELEENEEDLRKLEGWLGKVKRRDRFGAPLAEKAERAIEDCKEDLESFAASVYAASGESAEGGSPQNLGFEQDSEGRTT